VHHFRGHDEGLPTWLSRFVATGYATYSTQLPSAFADRGTSPAQLGAMLSFVFTLESLALAMGCERSQLLIAMEQAAPQAADPEKLGLLWAAEWLVQLKDEAAVRRAFDAVLEHPLGRRAFPRYLSGFLRALAFAPRAAQLSVELLGRAFVRLPDAVLLPWMPGLLTTLNEQARDVGPLLMKALASALPSPDGIERWSPPWMTAEVTPPAETNAAAPARAPGLDALAALLRAHPATLDAWATTLGLEASWSAAAASPTHTDPEPAPGLTAPGTAAGPAPTLSHALLAQHGDAARAWAEVLVGAASST
jgi:hypothetical protein